MKPMIRKHFNTQDKLVNFNSRFTTNKNTEKTSPNKFIVINVKDGYAVIVIPSGSAIESELCKIIKTNRYHDLDELEQAINNTIQLNRLKNSNNKTATVYTYYVTNSDDDKENIYNAGKVLDVATSILYD